jgi:ABC-2 type transport system ATP-binding protein
MASILALNNISKSYGQIRALKGVSFEVPAGSVFGILGPNGSGKTTLLGIVMDVLKASGGDFTWFGKTPGAEQRQQIGTLLETPNFYHYLSAERNLKIAAGIKQRPASDIDRVLKLVRLYERRTSKFQTFSLGMKQRLAIAACLLGDPSVLVFDEPTNGLDPSGIAEIRELIGSLAAAGKTVLLASHLLGEVEKVCTHVAILQQGTLLDSGTVGSVLAGEEWLEVACGDGENARQLLAGFPGVVKVETVGSAIQVHLPQAARHAEALNKYCFDHGIVLSQLVVRKKSLESEFIALTQNVSN